MAKGRKPGTAQGVMAAAMFGAVAWLWFAGSPRVVYAEPPEPPEFEVYVPDDALFALPGVVFLRCELVAMRDSLDVDGGTLRQLGKVLRFRKIAQQ